MIDYTDPNYHWTQNARCFILDKDKNPVVDVNIFFPPRDKTKYKKIANEAKNYCFGENRKNPCPVRTQCLWYAIDKDMDHGIWGGLSHRERNALVRKWNKKFRDEYTLEEYIRQLDNNK